MPFLDHLEELRWRIVWSLGAFVIGVGVSFYFLFTNDDFILRVLADPIQPYLSDGRLIYTHPAAAFRVIMNLSLLLGTILASPVIVWHLWGFLSPALYTHEKKVVIPILVMAALLFLAGVALSWFVILPLTLKVFTGVQSDSLQPMIGVTEYFGFAMGMSVALGLAFEPYDELGRLRSRDEHGNPVSGRGEITATVDRDGEVDGARALMERLATTGEARRCVARKIFLWTFARAPDKRDGERIRRLDEALAAGGGRLEEALVAMVRDPAYAMTCAREATP